MCKQIATRALHAGLKVSLEVVGAWKKENIV